MKQVINKIGRDRTLSTCPVSGLKIHQKPEWRDVVLGDGYKLTISLLGDNILVSQPHGYATYDATRKAGRLISDILANAKSKNRPYIQIEDYAFLKGASLEARKYFIEQIKSQEALLGLVFINVSPMIKLSIKLARRFNRVHVKVYLAENYEAAVRMAQTILTNRPTKIDDDPKRTDSGAANLSPDGSNIHKVRHHPDWHLQFDDFSIRFDVINDNVLHGIANGRLEKRHIEPSIQLQEEVTRSTGLPAGAYYYILGLKDSTGTGQKARKKYVNAILRLYKKYPFRMFIFYGTNRLIKAGINLAKPIIPFKVGIVDDLDQALALVKDDTADNASTGNFSVSSDARPTQNTIQQYVDELLQFLEDINWENSSVDNEKKRDPSHPFSSVFDAIELIKWEFEDLIKEQKKSEEKIRRAKNLAEKANNAKSEFLANMSHELRTPLNHIIGFTELVVDKNFGDLNDIQEEYLGDVIQSSKHLLALINDILDLSKVEAGKQKLECAAINPVHLLKDSLVMVKEKALKHSIHISLDIKDIPEAIEADGRMLKQILYNLLSNATKFTPDGGSVSVSAQVLDLNKEDYRGEDRGEISGLKISVSDSGIGIHPSDLKRIFNPFEQLEGSYSRNYQGTGLGLALCRNFVNLHGGKIWAESKGLGQGSAFHFVIPVDRFF